MNEKLQQIEGNLERIVYRNGENGFTVARVTPKEKNDLITAVGEMPSAFPGQDLVLTGSWQIHPQHGRQFEVEECEVSLPATESGIKKYLSSDLIKGVGPVLAERIIDHFGTETLAVMDSQPEKMTEVEGIGPQRLQTMKEGWEEGQEIRNIMLFLKEHEVSTSYAVRIYKEYGKATTEILRENPYRMASDVYGIGFKIADRIARKMGIEADDPDRLEAGLEYALQEATEKGHLYLPRKELIDEASELLEAEHEQLEAPLHQLLNRERIVVEEGSAGEPIYLAPLYWAEVGTAERIAELSVTSPPMEETEASNLLEKLQEKQPIDFNAKQREAIRKSLTERVLVLTGGPGTGKTTTVNGIINLWEYPGKRLALAAPTGRAAKRLEEATGKEAKTIHRLLGFQPPNQFDHHEDNKLHVDGLIVDELSMVDLTLMNNLLKALPKDTHLVLVGDSDQLPSVGAGNVLQDLINSETVEAVELTEIFRQARTSRIVRNAHRINRGEFPRLSNRKESDFFFIQESEPVEAARTIANLVCERLPRQYDLDPIREIQVMTPMHRGESGVTKLNERLQDRLNDNKPLDLSLSDREFKVGDKVMQIRNKYDKEVFNEDIGTITDYKEKEGYLKVDFPDSGETLYQSGDLSELVLAYAITIHKSQGSEYPAVVLPLLTQHYIMLQRNLLYTAITRAKELAVIVGTEKAVGIAVNNNKVERRNSLLARRLRESVEKS